jgi:hypothetical protein
MENSLLAPAASRAGFTVDPANHSFPRDDSLRRTSVPRKGLYRAHQRKERQLPGPFPHADFTITIDPQAKVFLI